MYMYMYMYTDLKHMNRVKVLLKDCTCECAQQLIFNYTVDIQAHTCTCIFAKENSL